MNFGPFIDVTAPGDSLRTTQWKTTDPNNHTRYAWFGMTSAAAPVVSGVTSLVRARFPNKSTTEVMDIVRNSAVLFNGWENDFDHYGHGMVNAYYAVAPPAAPTNLTSYLDSNPPCGSCHNTEYSVNLDWDDNTEPDLSHYIIYRAESPGNCNLCHQINNNPPEDSLSDPETLNEDVTVQQDCPALSGEITDFTKSKVEVETGCQSGLESTQKLTFEPIWAWSQSWWTDIRIQYNYTYTYFVTAVDAIVEQESDESNFTITYVPEGGLAKPFTEFPDEVVPKIFFLYQNYPNPFNPVTTIRFQLPEEARVTIGIFNVLGQKVKTLVDELKPSGYYSIIWNGKDDFENSVSSGIYICKMSAGKFVQIRKMILLK